MGEYLVFALAFIWFLLASLQSRMLNHESGILLLFVVAFITSTVWIVLVRRIVIGDEFSDIVAYSLGSALGVVTAKKLHTYRRCD